MGAALRWTSDKSPEMIAQARELAADHPDLTFLEGDFLAADLPAADYDFVCSVTTIHHMDFEAALTRIRELLRPEGAASCRSGGYAGRDPHMSHGEVGAVAPRLLPGVRCRRHVLRRYSLIWEKAAC